MHYIFHSVNNSSTLKHVNLIEKNQKCYFLAVGIKLYNSSICSICSICVISILQYFNMYNVHTDEIELIPTGGKRKSPLRTKAVGHSRFSMIFNLFTTVRVLFIIWFYCRSIVFNINI